jgi:glycosyltransferase involved in cell wall biosynthesis
MPVSWLIPVRDGRPWLAGCIQSALSACDAKDQVVIVDDGSQDRGIELCPDDPRITWISRPAEGIVAALEVGRAACKHEFIARLDVDDRALPGRIPAQISALKADPNLAVVGGAAVMVREDQQENQGMVVYVDWVNQLPCLHRELLVESPLFHPAVLMRAAAIDAVGGYREGDFPEDYDLWLRLVTAGYRLGAVSVPVVRILDRKNRLTRTDPRYRRAAFDALKQAWLERGPLKRPRRVAVWGAGRCGGRWIRWLKSKGHHVVGVVDPFCTTQRQGISVEPPSSLAAMQVDVLLVAVGACGARDEIRMQLALIRPDWAEGVIWWAVA